MLSLLPSLAAITLQPHSRLNQGCQPLWNNGEARYQIQFGQETVNFPYDLPGQTPGQPCGACIQRIWCTTNGAFGYYGAETETSPATLYFTWIGREDEMPVELPLSATHHDTEMRSTSAGEQGTVLVSGNTLYFYAYSKDPEDTWKLPVLSSVTFSAYNPAVAIETLYTKSNAIDIVGVASGIDFSAAHTVIYTPASGAVTVSVSGKELDATIAVDVLLTDLHTGAPQRTRVLMPGQLAQGESEVTVPSITTTTRQFLTLSGYTCAAFSEGKPHCHALALYGNWTWGAAQSVAGIQFSPLEGGFELPFSFWQPASLGFPALVATGFTPVLTELGDALVALHETEGSQLALAYYAISDLGVTLLRSQSTPKPSLTEPESAAAVPFSALAVKWTGPYTEQFSVFIAQDLTTGDYTAVDEQLCPVTQHISADGCADCSAGHSCNGITETECPAGTRAAFGAGSCEQCSAGFYSSVKSENCDPCGPGTYSRAAGSPRCTVCTDYQVAPGSGNTACYSCAMGEFPTIDNNQEEDPVETAASFCTMCPKGHFCPDGVLKEPCPPGFYQSQDGLSECDVCTESNYCPQGSVYPQACNRNYGKGAAECESCGSLQAWLNGKCVYCKSLPYGLKCSKVKGITIVIEKPTPNKWVAIAVVASLMVGLIILGVKVCNGRSSGGGGGGRTHKSYNHHRYHHRSRGPRAL